VSVVDSPEISLAVRNYFRVILEEVHDEVQGFDVGQDRTGFEHLGDDELYDDSNRTCDRGLSCQ
jgi:hypothetical protein